MKHVLPMLRRPVGVNEAPDRDKLNYLLTVSVAVLANESLAAAPPVDVAIILLIDLLMRFDCESWDEDAEVVWTPWRCRFSISRLTWGKRKKSQR